MNIQTVYQGLLERIRAFVATGVPPGCPEESIEVIAFLQAANESMERRSELIPM